MQISKTVMSPCKGCEDRCIGCHSTCGDYAEYKAKLERNRELQNSMNSEYEFRKRVKAEVTRRAHKNGN